MINLNIKEIQDIQSVESRLKDMHQVLSISISLANGMVWKDKTKSFYEVIAKELKMFFDDNIIEDVKLKKFRNKHLRVSIPNNSLVFFKNNLFEEQTELIDKENWLNQRLVVLENKELPNFLTGNDKRKIFRNLNIEEQEIINRSYDRQELNSDRFILNLIKEEQEKLLNILTRYGYFSITVDEYIEMIATGKYNYKSLSSDYAMKVFKRTYNNYILELGAYIAKIIENYLNER